MAAPYFLHQFSVEGHYHYSRGVFYYCELNWIKQSYEFIFNAIVKLLPPSKFLEVTLLEPRVCTFSTLKHTD